MSKWDAVLLPEGWRFEALDEVESTNDELRQREDASTGLVILAERQTAGRGRRGAAWLSCAGESLTFSVLLQPEEPKAVWPRLSLVAGLAVVEALESCGLEAWIKWPNDVLVGGKKICGVLVEATADRVIIGIGLNVGSMSFPEGLEATSMALESGSDWDRGDVLSRVLRSLNGWASEIGAGFPRLIQRVRERCALTGETVRLTSGDRQVMGTVVEVGDSGELTLSTKDGIERFVQAHEVRVIGGSRTED